MSSASPVLLMMPLAADEDEKTQETNKILCLHSLKNQNNPSYKLTDSLDYQSIVGSSHGWIAFLDEKAANPFLLNPFSKTRIRLPEKQTLPRILDVLRVSGSDYVSNSSRIDKVVLCETPSNGKNFAVVAMYSSWYHTQLAFCRHGDEQWTNLDGEAETYYDVVCCDQTSMVFALGPGPTVEVWDFNETVPKKRMTIQGSCPRRLAQAHHTFPSDLYSSNWYLALSLEQVFLVVRYIGEFVRYDGEVVYEGDTLTDYANEPLVCPYKTVGFHVYKLDVDMKEWIEVEDLNGFSMFLGGNQSMMVETKGPLELKGNAIYFTDDYWDRMDEDYCYGGHDMGVFNMEDGSIDPVLDCGDGRIEPPPFWISVPSDCQ